MRHRGEVKHSTRKIWKQKGLGAPPRMRMAVAYSIRKAHPTAEQGFPLEATAPAHFTGCGVMIRVVGVAGRARHGDLRAPQFKGGGKAHGKRQRNFATTLPQKAPLPIPPCPRVQNSAHRHACTHGQAHELTPPSSK